MNVGHSRSSFRNQNLKLGSYLFIDTRRLKQSIVPRSYKSWSNPMGWRVRLIVIVLLEMGPPEYVVRLLPTVNSWDQQRVTTERAVCPDSDHPQAAERFDGNDVPARRRSLTPVCKPGGATLDAGLAISRSKLLFVGELRPGCFLLRVAS